jgi:DNA-binding NtrC family response regulator
LAAQRLFAQEHCLLSSSDYARVLVIDDETAIADTLARILRHHGFNTLTEYSAKGAARVAEDFNPDVLITDIVMPGINGIDLAEWFCKTYPACRIILMSANLLHFDDSFLSFEHTQEIAFFPKPVRIPDLLEVLAGKKPAA